MRRSSFRPGLLIADDHQLVVDMLVAALSKQCRILATVNDAESLLASLKRNAADVILLDVGLPGRNGLTLIPPIHRVRPLARIIVLTMHNESTMADAALNAGAMGFVSKSAPLAELEAAIDNVLRGRNHVSKRYLHRVDTAEPIDFDGFGRLTPRQQQVLLLFGRGHSAVEISRRLGIGPSTIAFHKHLIMSSLQFADDAALVRYAVLVSTLPPQTLPAIGPRVSPSVATLR